MNKKVDIAPKSVHHFTVTDIDTHKRADTFISSHFENYSRTFLQRLFKNDLVHLNATGPIKASSSLKVGDTVSIYFSDQILPAASKIIPDDIGVKIIAQEEDFLIIFKPAHIISHPPSQFSEEITISDWIAKNYADIAKIGLIDRPGIVHRLDKETSGLMIIPRTNKAHTIFGDMFKNREVKKSYLAVVQGHPQKSGTIDFSIGRHPIQRNKMSHFPAYSQESNIKQASTFYQVLTYFDNHALVQAFPVTGRTHQIRVHFSAIGHPLVADPIYGNNSKLIKRHALHAYSLEFSFEGKNYSFISPLPEDMQQLVKNLESQSKHVIVEKIL